MGITNEILNNFNQCPVEVVNYNGVARKGWFIKIDNEYKLFPFDTIWNVYVYKASQIKSIKHLTNNFGYVEYDCNIEYSEAYSSRFH